MIRSAAIKYYIFSLDKEVILPLHRHGDGGKILERLGFTPDDVVIITQGFLADHEVFLNRREALDEAIKCGQISIEDPQGYDIILSGQLMSEDLW